MTNLVIPSIFTAIDRMTNPLRTMGKSIKGLATVASDTARRASKSLSAINDKASSIAQSTGVAGAAILAPLGLATKSAIEFEDKMSDVAKTTGLSGAALDGFGKDLLNYSKKTRTSVQDLQTIAEIGGQLGVPTEELQAFTKSANEFNVALGSDFSGGVEEAISSVGKIKSLFKETRSMPIADVTTKTGSAVNQLSAVGAGTSANINDFILRMGQLPDALKPSLTNTAALGTLFEEVGIDAQIGAGGLSNFYLVAAKNLSGFAKQMHMTTGMAKELLEVNPAAFATSFASSLQGMKPDEMANKLNDLKIGSQETIKVIGALGSGTARFAELQDVANKAFQEGTSLSQEYATKNSTTAAKLAQAKNNLEALTITLGTKLLPVISRILDAVTPVLDKVGAWIDANPELTTTILTATGALGGLLLGISGISTAVAALTSPIGLVVAGIAAVGVIGYMAYKKSEPFRQSVSKLWESVKELGGTLWDLIKRIAPPLLAILGYIGQTVIRALIPPFRIVTKVLGLVFGLFGRLADFAQNHPWIATIGKGIMALVTGPLTLFTWALNKIADLLDLIFPKEIKTPEVNAAYAGSTAQFSGMRYNRTVGVLAPMPAQADPVVSTGSMKDQDIKQLSEIMGKMRGSVDVNVSAAPGSKANVSNATGIAQPGSVTTVNGY